MSKYTLRMHYCNIKESIELCKGGGRELLKSQPYKPIMSLTTANIKPNK